MHEQKQFGFPIEITEYAIEVSRDTLENWQSEFLQLIWQVSGLALLLYIDSPQSKESDDRAEAKLDPILTKVDPHHARQLIKKIDTKYLRL